MRSRSFGRRICVTGAVLGAGIVLAGARPPPGATVPAEPAPRSDSLAGQFLVATPEMGDPRFYHTVILLAQHDERGALGLIVNRPVGERPLAELLAALGEKGGAASGRVRIFLGGPVQPEVGFVVHTAEYRRAGTIDIDGRVAMTSSLQVLRDLGAGKGPQKSLVLFGYSGWQGGQLEDELAQGAWFTEPEDPKLVFDDDRGKVWDEAVARRTYPL